MLIFPCRRWNASHSLYLLLKLGLDDCLYGVASLYVIYANSSFVKIINDIRRSFILDMVKVRGWRANKIKFAFIGV